MTSSVLPDSQDRPDLPAQPGPHEAAGPPRGRAKPADDILETVAGYCQPFTDARQYAARLPIPAAGRQALDLADDGMGIVTPGQLEPDLRI
jgi:hypothetical protein